jgi:hypothetical protein
MEFDYMNREDSINWGNNEEQNMADVLVQDRVTSYDFGVGVIEPTGKVTEQQLVQEMDARQAPVEGSCVVCFDERKGVGFLSADMDVVEVEKLPIHEKLAGGTLVTAVAMAKLARWSGFTEEQLNGPIEEQIDAVADHLVENEEILGAHVDTDFDKDGDASKCGAADNLEKENETIAIVASNPEFIAKSRNTLGDNFDEAIHAEILSNAGEDTQNGAYDGYKPKMFTTAVLKRDGVVEVLSAANIQPDVDPENKRHGHFGEGLKVNTEEGKSNDRDAAEIPFFQADAPALIRIAKKMANSEEELPRLLHAGVVFQYAVEYVLTKNMPNIF